MINGITKYNITKELNYDFSVLIPSWNNLEILKNCIKSIKKNSSLSIQPIVIANEAKDGTLEWLQSQEIDFVHSKENLGVCYALNICRTLIKSNYVVYLNDDMYVLPGWDTCFQREIKAYNGNDFMFSGTMIEPTDTGNKCVIIKNYGNGLDNFEEEKLLQEFTQLKKENWSGASWPPNVVHIDTWDLVGGLSIEYSPGMYSDPDFSMKLYKMGVRNFKGIADCKVYHFGSKSTKRVKKNTGKKMFINKWGISPGDFYSQFLKLGKPYKAKLQGVKLSKIRKLKNWVKRMIN